jgi:3'-phosphoadenosine 5'-phosphosulfate (PAPS) 3'-phosphatase
LLNHFGGKMTKLNGQDIDYNHQESPKNEGGLVAALHDHQKYLDAFKEYAHE